MDRLKVLMLEDNPLDAQVIEKLLSSPAVSANLKIVNNAKDYNEQLTHYKWDLILCDHQLPDYDSIRALKAKNEVQPGIPFILITGAVPEDEAVELMREGADEYVMKNRLQGLPRVINKVTEKYRTEYAKKSLEVRLSDLTQRFQMAAKASIDIIWDYDVKREIIYCSDAIEKVTGIKLKNYFRPEYLMEFVHEDDIDSVKRSFALLQSGLDNRWRKIFRVRKNDGSIVWINSNALILRDKHDEVSRVTGVMQDVTEIRSLQHELIEQEQLKQKHIAEITIAAQEKERQEIGRELHDNVNQLLATAKIMIDTARSIPDMHDLCLTKSQESIMEAIQELRSIAHSMIPPVFEKNDLDGVILNLVNNIMLSGMIDIEVDLPDKEELSKIDNKVKLAFYRIIQEQLINILKYSKASNVHISIEVLQNDLCLVIGDDGVGCEPEKRQRGIGFRNMESRVQLLDGTMSIVSQPGEGCMVRLMVPRGRGEELRVRS